ncbi:MAG: hypothetical protein KJ058_00635 [Thermoanaerobaculia bacterium]|nr:hypothetical protein [Thermoanaerobaculia bacterium]
MPLNHFLILYNVRKGQLVEAREFGEDVQQAIEEYAVLEREYRDRADHLNFEIVLIGADSRETLEVTHSRYFTAVELEALPF